MFLDKYLNKTYLDLVYSNYELNYINALSEENFNKIFKFLKKEGFNYINDIILDYLELFQIDYACVVKAFDDVKKMSNNNYTKSISHNMTLIDMIIKLSKKYEEIVD